MKTKTISTLILLFSILATGCSGKTTDKIEERNGLIYAPNETEPFTGTFETKYSNGQKEQEAHFKDGKANGFSTVWSKNGQKYAEVNFKDGKQIN